MKDISYEELRKIQIDVLKYVHDFCIRHGINYSLAYGTLLGAVRHGGYIPWDDDIDIAMMRDDYERFAKEFNSEDSFYRFYDCRNDEKVNISFGKVADTRTMVIEGANTKNLGVAIDVFPIDDLCDTRVESQLLYRKFNLTKKLLILKCRKLSDVRCWWKKPLFAVVKAMTFWYQLHNIPLNITQRILKYRNPHSIFVGLVVDGGENEIVERRIWSAYQDTLFEGHHFMAIKDTDSYLKYAYGDYMKLPPENERVPKHDFYKMYWLD